MGFAYYSDQLEQTVNIYKDNVEKARASREPLPTQALRLLLHLSEAADGTDLHIKARGGTSVKSVSPKCIVLCT